MSVVISELSVGDRVVCNCPGSWVHGRAGVIDACEAVAPDGVRGCIVRMDVGGLTVVPAVELVKVGREPDADALDALRLILAEPYGCHFCDSGKPRNPEKECAPECGFRAAREVLARAERGNA